MAKATENKIKVSELIPDDKNFNKGSEFGNSLISKSFEKFGAGRSILIDKNNKIIAGNKSTENYGAGGGEDVIVVESDGTKLIAVKRTDIDLDTPEGRELALADNATAKANIVWAEDVIASELGVEVGESWGVDMGKEIPEAEEDDFDTTPPEEPKTVLGDLYEIGEHRLLCGDSTDSEQVDKLMNGEKADMVFTDPPYGVDVVGNSGNIGGNTKNAKAGNYSKIIGDDKPYDPSHLFIFDCFIFIWGANYFIDKLPSRGQWVVWDKNRPEGTTFSDCELAWTNGDGIAIKKYKCTWDGFHREGEKEKRVHPTQKPIKLCSDILNNLSKTNEIIIDLFLGSGSTMVASHQLKRKCYGMELDCKYCDVIVKRMITLDPTLTIKLNGVDVTNEWKA